MTVIDWITWHIPLDCRGRRCCWWWRRRWWWWYEVVDERWRKSSEQLTTDMPGHSAACLGRKTTRRGSQEQSRDERFPKTLFALSRCRIARMRVPETCSPGRPRSRSKPFRTLQLEGQETKTKNCKKRPRPHKARSRISADHSRRCRAPAPSASPHPARRGEHARVGFSFSS